MITMSAQDTITKMYQDVVVSVHGISTHTKERNQVFET